MRFGNWNVTEEELSWAGGGYKRFVIGRDDLLVTTQNNLHTVTYYKWILAATDEDWLTEDDLYDLNYAFVYAAAKFNLGFDYTIFDATLAEQYEQFDEEENDPWD